MNFATSSPLADRSKTSDIEERFAADHFFAGQVTATKTGDEHTQSDGPANCCKHVPVG